MYTYAACREVQGPWVLLGLLLPLEEQVGLVEQDLPRRSKLVKELPSMEVVGLDL